MKYLKTCEWCNKEHWFTKKKYRFCSTACGNRARGAAWKRNCPECQSVLTYTYAQSYSIAKKRNSSCVRCSHLESNNRPETKRKNRLAQIADRERKLGQNSPNYNPMACKAIDEFGKRNGFNFQHAENGGEFYIEELGFWVDGYDAEQNIVIEYDESHHARQREKDRQRQQEIQEHLGCTFIRIK